MPPRTSSDDGSSPQLTFSHRRRWMGPPSVVTVNSSFPLTHSITQIKSHLWSSILVLVQCESSAI
ncbi:uncharacterized protein TrAtP1_001722 [Trichoderma atroviride]|uniref:uncharacterized protein n=1 Tax=Hypocrea atroviridis TaxID=63577 RepID=UPI00332C1656|nr:hypothetical protein TrAtP1_001722 [Trichoderma atroviride]